MNHYDYQRRLREIWEKAVETYQGGTRGAENFFDKEEVEFLQSIGQTAQEMYDYAEDYVGGGEPDFATVAMVSDIRRSYFLEAQKSQPSGQTLDPETLPPKSESVDGVEWLPRIIPKAKAKLRGELDPDIMYGCGGDRNFLRTNNIHSAEFLRLVWDNIDNDRAVIDWVLARRG